MNCWSAFFAPACGNDNTLIRVASLPSVRMKTRTSTAYPSMSPIFFPNSVVAANPLVSLNPIALVGEATAIYIAKLLHPLGVKVTRIARGLPVGTDLQFADSQTLAKALEGRVEF